MEGFTPYLVGILGIIVTVLIAVITWSSNISGRVSVLEALLGSKMEEINRRLERIEGATMSGRYEVSQIPTNRRNTE